MKAFAAGVSFAALLTAGPSFAGNFATCALDKLPGVQNDQAAYAAWNVCNAKYPGYLGPVGQGSGRGLFSFDSGSECTLKTGADTRSAVAAKMIYSACAKLYDAPPPKNYFDKFDPSTARPFNGKLDGE